MHQPLFAHLSAFGRIAPLLGVAAILIGGLVLIFSSMSLRPRALTRRIEMVQPRPESAELGADFLLRRARSNSSKRERMAFLCRSSGRSPASSARIMSVRMPRFYISRSSG